MMIFIRKFKLILIILSIIIFGCAFAHVMPIAVKVFLYTLSNCIRQILLFALPFLIFPFMVTSVASMKSKGAYLIGSILILVMISNFISIMIPFFVAKIFVPLLNIHPIIKSSTLGTLEPLFDLKIKPLIQIDYILLIALICGLTIGFTKTQKYDRFLINYVNLSQSFFERIFIPTLPIYVLGTVLKIAHETEFKNLLITFGGMIFLIVCVQISYILFMYYIGSGRDLKKTIFSVRNALQSSIVGFSTMSSVVTMPVTLQAAEKNIPEDPASARVIITSTVNCHDVGECISLSMIALTIYYITNGIFPDLNTYIGFAVFATIAQFSGVAVPGGSIIIILPFLIRDLGFSDEMCSMIIAVSIFMDPLGTANNVFGNGAFAMIVYRIQRYFTGLQFKYTKG